MDERHCRQCLRYIIKSVATKTIIVAIASTFIVLISSIQHKSYWTTLQFCAKEFFLFMNNRSLNTTTKLCYLAVLSALSVVAKIFSIPIAGSNSISFFYIPVYIASIYFGPVAGGVVGLVGDLAGFLIRPTGPFSPFVLASSVLLGVIPGLIWLFTKKTNLHYAVKLIISLVISSIIVTSCLNTVGLWLMYASSKKTFWFYLAERLPFQILMVVINGIALSIILAGKTIDKLLSRSLRGTTDNKEL